ncbi:hypothetical protein WJX82_009490 [Trebouxia sp. C0006]
MQVAVIGAGVAGLQQGRALQKRSFDFHIYETEIGVGGVWRTTAHLQGAQVTYPYYEFPEFPWPDALIQKHRGAVTPPAPVVQQCTPSSFNWSPASVSQLLSQSCGRQQHGIVAGVPVAKHPYLQGLMLSRQACAHFWLPLNLLGFIPCDYIKYSCFGVWLSTHPYPSSYPSLPRITQFIHRIMTPVKQAIWKSMGMLLPWQSGLPPEMIPVRGAEEDTFAELGTINPGSIFLKHLHTGKIKVVPGQAIPADLVIYATGFERKYDYLAEETLKALHQTEEGIPWYRDTIPTDVQGLAFVGSEVITFNTVTNSALQAEWLAALLQGAFDLPPKDEQRADVARKQAWRYSFIPPHNFRAGRLAHCHQLLWDELLCDMGYSKYRKGWGLLKEVWQPYKIADYRDIFMHTSSKV